MTLAICECVPKEVNEPMVLKHFLGILGDENDGRLERIQLAIITFEIHAMQTQTQITKLVSLYYYYYFYLDCH